MCDPLSIAMAGLSFATTAGSAVLGHQAQTEAANEQNRMFEANRQNALRAHADKETALNRRIGQEQEAAAQDKFDASLKARQARATNVVAAGEAGVSGLSLEGLLNDISNANSRFGARVDKNVEWTGQQLEEEKRATGFQTLDRINSVKTAKGPSFMALGLQIAGAGLDAASSARTWSKGGTVSRRSS